MISEELEEIKRERKLASFYSDKDNTSKFIVGYVEGISDDYIVISLVSPEGLFDGLLLKELNSIYRVSTDSTYLEKMQMLLAYYNQPKEQFSSSGNNLVIEMLEFSQKNNYVVSLELVNSKFDDIVGYVHKLWDDGCSINEITDDGRHNGNSTVDYSDISQISCNSIDEKIPGILWLLRNK